MLRSLGGCVLHPSGGGVLYPCSDGLLHLLSLLHPGGSMSRPWGRELSGLRGGGLRFLQCLGRDLPICGTGWRLLRCACSTGTRCRLGCHCRTCGIGPCSSPAACSSACRRRCSRESGLRAMLKEGGSEPCCMAPSSWSQNPLPVSARLRLCRQEVQTGPGQLVRLVLVGGRRLAADRDHASHACAMSLLQLPQTQPVAT